MAEELFFHDFKVPFLVDERIYVLHCAYCCFTSVKNKQSVNNSKYCFWFPAPRILFWTDWDATYPRIEAASMSGGGRHIVFKDMEIGAWPNGLTLDHLEKRIVWTDARYTIRVHTLRRSIQTLFHLSISARHYTLGTCVNPPE